MKIMKKVFALILVLALLLTLAACGKEEKKGGTTTTKKPTTTTAAPTTTTTTTPGDDLLPDDERDGSKELPFEIGGVLEFDAVVEAHGVTYYDVYRVNGTVLTIENKDVMVEYEGKTYDPKDGVVSFTVDSGDVLNPVKLAIGNTGDTDATFKVTFTYPAGTKLNPITLEEGDLVTTLKEGNEQGLVYLFTAPDAGTLTIVDKAVVKEGVSYDISLFNLSTSAIRTLGEDAVEKDGVKTVSIEVSKGDQVEVTIATLMNDKNEYPAATIKTQVVFSKGDVTPDQPDRTVDYTVTVKDQNGNPVAGVEMAAQVDLIRKPVTTDSKGVGTFVLPEGTPCVMLLTIPDGYVAASKTHWFKEGSTSLTIVLEKEQPVTPPTTPTNPGNPTEPTTPEVTTMDYTVTLQDGKGNPLGGLTVEFYSGDKAVAKKVGDKKGVSTVTLERGTYTVKVSGTDLKYDQKAAVVSVNNPAVTLTLAADIDTSKSYKLVVTQPDGTDRKYTVYYLSEGAAYVTLVPGERNYFMFEPTHDGTYRFAASNSYAKIGQFGTDMFVYTENVAEVSGNAFNISVRETELGNVYVIGIDAATNCSAAVVQVTRIGDPAWSIEDEPTVEYQGNGAPAQVTAPSGLTDIDIKSATEYHLVYNEKDGYYHLNSANGPVVYLRLDHPSASIVGLLSEFGNMTAYLYNADGTFKAKEQYAVLMQQYVDKMDKTQKVYPLTKDLEYMIRNFGNSQNWWNEGEPGYLFEEVSGVNPANAWMFLFCYK